VKGRDTCRIAGDTVIAMQSSSDAPRSYWDHYEDGDSGCPGADSGPYPGPVDELLRTAAEVMLTIPARHPLSATVGEIRDFFRDDHVHAALIVSPAGYLEAVVERDDIAGCQARDAAASPLGQLAGRTVPAGASLAEVRRAMTTAGRRRAAVTSADGRLVGLLCLKASGAGFCSNQDIRARALGDVAARAAAQALGPYWVPHRQPTHRPANNL
jgi:CBS domain-containing protein